MKSGTKKTNPSALDQRVLEIVAAGTCRFRDIVVCMAAETILDEKRIDRSLQWLRRNNKVTYNQRDGWQARGKAKNQ
jgi:hypothetical protein